MCGHNTGVSIKIRYWIVYCQIHSWIHKKQLFRKVIVSERKLSKEYTDYFWNRHEYEFKVWKVVYYYDEEEEGDKEKNEEKEWVLVLKIHLSSFNRHLNRTAQNQRNILNSFASELLVWKTINDNVKYLQFASKTILYAFGTQLAS